MNHLTFSTEYIKINEAGEDRNYLAFYFFIDGRKIELEEYTPAAWYDVLDEHAKEQNLFVIAHCTCGCWQCSSIVAREVYLPDNVVEWTVDEYRCERNPQKYYFDKAEYEKVMAEIIKTAETFISELKLL